MLLRRLTTGPIKWRLTIAYVAVIWACMTIAGFILSYLIETQYTVGYTRVLNSHASLVKGVIEESFAQKGLAVLSDNTCRDLSGKINARVQLYDPAHRLIADSSRGTMEDDPAATLRGFACFVCHAEARSPEVMSVTKNLRVGKQNIGAASVSVSVFGIKQAAARSRRVILSALVIAAVLAAVLSQRLAFSIARPITDMSKVARRMSEGDLTQRAPVEGNDEISQLAVGFNTMAMQIEKMLRESTADRDRMETILTTMADGIVITDEEGRVVLFNKASERIFGHSAQDIIGRPIYDLGLHPELAEMVRETLSTQRMVRKELRLVGDSESFLSAYSTTVKDQPSEVKGAVVVLYDLTEIIRHEHAQKEFVANVSHELRTPITAVRVTSEALLSGAKDDPALLDRFLTTLVKESERLSALIDDLLEVAKLESGRIAAKRVDVDLRDVAETIENIHLPEAGRRGVRLTLDVPELHVFADERQVQQVLGNLVDNAIKYTPTGGSITVNARENERAVSISVSDTGIGVPQGDVPRIFERFYRVDRARSRELGGTGLGLAIVKDIMDSHGGTISVQTRVNEGSTFTVTFPKTT